MRDKRYAGARRSLTRYAEGLAGVRDSLTLRGLIDHEGLARGLDALEAVDGVRISEPQELRERLAPALAHPHTAAEAHNALGVLHALREETDLARAEFDRTLALAPKHYRALTNIGNLLLEAGDLNGAEVRYQQALEFNEDYAGAHHNLAVVQRRQKRLGASVRSLKRSQRLAVRQASTQGREEAREKYRVAVDPALVVRIVLGVVALVIVLLVLRGAGG